jgi:DNA-binding SARP family transcriptional activator
MQTITVKMLGDFCLQTETAYIHNGTSRANKSWLLLAVLLCSRGRPVSKKKLLENLWLNDKCDVSNLDNSLRITLHRSRALLDALWPGAGKDLIITKGTEYSWNWKYKTLIDVERFEELCSTKINRKASIDNIMAALELYDAEFLQNYSSELWVLTLREHYHKLYTSAAKEAVKKAYTDERGKEIADYCRRVLEADPYNEKLAQILMDQLGLLGDHVGVKDVYEKLFHSFVNDLDRFPSEETKEAYARNSYIKGGESFNMETVIQQLMEDDTLPGALQCNFDYFKFLCRAEIRDLQRTKGTSHVALITVSTDDKKLKNSKKYVALIEHLGTRIKSYLRRGDAFAQCTSSQYVLLLPRANYENSCMVCRRCIGAFKCAYPETKLKISFSVHPL